MKKIWGNLIICLGLLIAAPAFAEDLGKYSTPDDTSRQMYLRGIPAEAIMTATVQNIVNKTPKHILKAASTCVKKYMEVNSYQDVVKVIIAAHPGVYSATSQAGLHTTSEGQKVLFFCGEAIEKADTVVKSEIHRTMGKYIQLAFHVKNGSKYN